ncbi:MAG: sugar phosphate isomerase/epimerase [Chthoniobacterales bacterium]|nr:sugar phosphate isomerase/epimerase [Chthoniobacterales bacterium]
MRVSTGHRAVIGLQAWTFKHLGLVEVMAKAGKLGITKVQAFPGQELGGGLKGKFEPAMVEESNRGKLRDLLRTNGSELVSLGVVNAEDEPGWRELFAFAKAFDVPDLTVEPPAGDVPLLDKLSREYGTPVSIHNHGGNLEERLDQLKAFGPHMGLCIDTGHWVRHGREPVPSLRLAQGRLHSVHLKDMSAFAQDAHTVPFGEGVSDLRGQLAELDRQGFNGIVFIEHEHHTPHLEADVEKCIEVLRRAGLTR